MTSKKGKDLDEYVLYVQSSKQIICCLVVSVHSLFGT